MAMIRQCFALAFCLSSKIIFFYPKAVSKIADGVTGRWQQLVTRAEERHKLVTASLNFYKTAEQVRNNRFVFTENIGENFDVSRFLFTATGDDSVRAFSRQITSLSYCMIQFDYFFFRTNKKD